MSKKRLAAIVLLALAGAGGASMINPAKSALGQAAGKVIGGFAGGYIGSELVKA